MKKALITGITGQDAVYLTEFLLKKKYKVYGSFRRSSNTNFWRAKYLGIQDHHNLHLVELDITDFGNCLQL